MQKIIQMKANDAAKLQDAQSGGTTESIRRTHATAKPGSDRTRATTGEAGPARGPGNAAVPRGELPASRAQRDSHTNRARLRREEEPREAGLGNNGDLAQCGSEHDRAERLLRRRVLLQKRQDLRPESTASLHHEGRKLHLSNLKNSAIFRNESC